MNNTFFLSEVLLKMSTLNSDGRAVPFSISVRTCNRWSKTGGKILSYPVAKMVMKEKNKKENSIASLSHRANRVVSKRNPNHWDNKTRNIKLPSGEIKKINILFIISFNGKKVVY